MNAAPPPPPEPAPPRPAPVPPAPHMTFHKTFLAIAARAMRRVHAEHGVYFLEKNDPTTMNTDDAIKVATEDAVLAAICTEALSARAMYGHNAAEARYDIDREKSYTGSQSRIDVVVQRVTADGEPEAGQGPIYIEAKRARWWPRRRLREGDAGLLQAQKVKLDAEALAAEIAAERGLKPRGWVLCWGLSGAGDDGDPLRFIGKVNELIVSEDAKLEAEGDSCRIAWVPLTTSIAAAKPADVAVWLWICLCEVHASKVLPVGARGL